MLTIPKQLQVNSFRFVKTKPFEKRVWKHCTKELKRTDITEKMRVKLYQKLIRPKTPSETGYKKDKNYKYDDPKFKKYLKSATGAALLTGEGDVIVIESDSKEISDFVDEHCSETFTVCSRKNQPHRKHYYLKVAGIEHAIPLGDDADGNHLGEIQAGKTLVTIPGSIHAITGEPYTIVNDVPIASLEKKEFYDIFKPYIQERLESEYTEDYYQDFPEYNIDITDIVDINQLKQQGEGRWQGIHPVHGSGTGRNFAVYPDRNYWKCFRHNTYGGVFSLIAVKHGIIDCGDVKCGCLKGKKWEETLQIARDEYGLEIKTISPAVTVDAADGSTDPNTSLVHKISLGSHAYLLYDSDGNIAKVSRMRKGEKIEHIYKGCFKPLRRLILDGQPYFEVDFGDPFIGNCTQIVNKMKERGGVISNFQIIDAVNAVLADIAVETIHGHATYGIYRKDDSLYYCINPFPKTDEQKMICNEMQRSVTEPLTKEKLQAYADMLKFWDDYEIFPAMSYGIMASFAFVLRQKGIMFQFLWHDSLESDLGKTTIGLIFSTYLWGIPDASGDSLASAFRVSDTLDSVGGLRVINEAEKIPWRSSVGQILKTAAERSMANKRGKSSGGSDYYFSRAGFILTSNGFPITSGNDLVRVFKIEFNVDKKRQRQQNREVSKQLVKKIRQLQPIGYQLVLHELDDVNHSLSELLERVEQYGDEIVDTADIAIKSNRRVTGYGIIYEGLKAWERLFQQYGIKWAAPSIKEFSKNIVEKIENFTYESRIPPITEFLFWLLNYRHSPSGEILHQETWQEKNVKIDETDHEGVVLCYPVLAEFKRQTKNHQLNNLADIARSVSSITGFPIDQIYHPRKFKVGNIAQTAVFIPDNIFQNLDDDINIKPAEIDLKPFVSSIRRYEEVIGTAHVSGEQLRKRLNRLDGEHWQFTIDVINTAIKTTDFETSLAIDENGNYYNNGNIKNENGVEKNYIVTHPQNPCNFVTKGVPTEEKTGYNDGESNKGHCNASQQKEKEQSYKVTTISKVCQYKEKNKQKYHCIQSIKELNKIIDTITKNNVTEIAIDTETTAIDPLTADLVGISFSYQPFEAYYIPVGHSNKQLDYKNLPLKQVLDILQENILENKTISKIGQNIKYDYHIFKNHGITIDPISFDTMLASYVINPDNRKSLDKLAKRHCNYTMQPISDLIGKGKKQITFDKVSIDKACFYACEDADLTLQVYHQLKKLLESDENTDVKQVLYDIELPLITVIADMERTGIKVDEQQIKQYSTTIQLELEQLKKDIHKKAGASFNIDSTRELQKILYEKQKLPVVKKTPKGQPSTDNETLHLLVDKHELPGLLLRYRELSKLQTTYLSTFPQYINNKTQRVHASFNQAGTVSGRFSSSHPNLQNIPAGIRKSVIPRDKNHCLLAADYSQMELRILADFSQDKHLIKAFQSKKDVHTLTASHVFNIPYSKVTKQQRNIAKTVNFGIVYGMSPYGLAARTDLSKKDAEQFISDYFILYPDVKRYISKIKGFAVKHGYVFTKFNRRVHLKKVFSKNQKIKQEGLRQAQNIPIQGTGADIIKLVMSRIHEPLIPMKSRLVLSIHDELVFDAYNYEIEQVKKIVTEEMEHAVDLCVPLDIDIGVGGNWYEAKH